MKTPDLNIQAIRADFPILQSENRGKPLVYLDSAVSAQKPIQVIQAMSDFYTHEYANIHRGVYELSEYATKRFEDARQEIANFINAPKADNIIFVKGTTEAINLVSQSFGRSQWQAGDEVILSTMEHHANIVPWYLLSQQIGIQLKVIPVTDQGELDLQAYKALFSPRTKFVSLTHVSNVLGTINPVKEIVEIAHQHQVPILLDGAQAVCHLSVDVQDLDCDFYAFSSHKLYGPTGIGILYAKADKLAAMPPYQGGGDMIETVSFDKVTFAKAPAKFEAGTPDIGGVIGLAAAIEYVSALGMQNIAKHDQQLLAYAQEKLLAIPGLSIIGQAKNKIGVISFILNDVHAHDIASILDHEGIAIRAGHHCAMPLMERFHLSATARASFGVYTQEKEIDALVQALHLAKRLFA